jgi:hypothetical protein
MMVPHHQGAIDMAKAELEYGHNEQLRRMAQQIVAAQQKEIATMRLAVDEQLQSLTQLNASSSSMEARGAMQCHSMHVK